MQNKIPYEELSCQIRAGHLTFLEFLKTNPTFDAKQTCKPNDIPYLHQACHETDVAVIYALADREGCIQQIDRNGRTVLHHLCDSFAYSADVYGRYYIVRFLLDMVDCPCMDLVDNDGFSALAFAVFNSHIPIVVELLQRGAKPCAPAFPSIHIVDGMPLEHSSKKANTINNILTCAKIWYNLPLWRPSIHATFPDSVIGPVKTLLCLRWARLACIDEFECAYPQACLAILPEEIFQYIVAWVLDGQRAEDINELRKQFNGHSLLP
jgi:hypothetical protein